MSHVVTIKLGAFASDALAEGREDLLRAARFYLNEKGKDGPAWDFPKFMREGRPGREVELELDVDDSLWLALEAEAKRQQVSIEQLLEHAALYYAAELDAGRVTERILEDSGDG